MHDLAGAPALEDALFAESIDVNRAAAGALSSAERRQLVEYLHRIIATLLPIVCEGNGGATGGAGG